MLHESGNTSMYSQDESVHALRKTNMTESVRFNPIPEIVIYD